MKIYLVIQEANGVPKTPDGVWFMNHGAFVNYNLAQKRMEAVMKEEGISLNENKDFVDSHGNEAMWQFDVWEVKVEDVDE